MSFTPDNYLALWDILVYEIVGGVGLATVIGLILIGFFSAKNAIPFQVGLIMMLLFLAIVVAITGDMGLWVIIVFIIGTIFYGLISRVLRRG